MKTESSVHLNSGWPRECGRPEMSYSFLLFFLILVVYKNLLYNRFEFLGELIIQGNPERENCEGLKSMDTLKFNEQGLIPVIVQDADNREVLMMAWMNQQALDQTVTTGRATYWSRSRGKLWVKGETSGHFQAVKEIRVDCDADTLLLSVVQQGVACHTGSRTCFYREFPIKGEDTVAKHI